MTPMKKLWLPLMLAFLLSGFALPHKASACPSCQAALDKSCGPESDDPMQEARAYAHSIYLMAGMPYLILGVAGVAFYRSVKKAQKQQELASSTT